MIFSGVGRLKSGPFIDLALFVLSRKETGMQATLFARIVLGIFLMLLFSPTSPHRISVRREQRSFSETLSIRQRAEMITINGFRNAERKVLDRDRRQVLRLTMEQLQHLVETEPTLDSKARSQIQSHLKGLKKALAEKRSRTAAL